VAAAVTGTARNSPRCLQRAVAVVKPVHRRVCAQGIRVARPTGRRLRSSDALLAASQHATSSSRESGQEQPPRRHGHADRSAPTLPSHRPEVVSWRSVDASRLPAAIDSSLHRGPELGWYVVAVAMRCGSRFRSAPATERRGAVRLRRTAARHDARDDSPGVRGRAKRLLPRWFVGVHATSGIRRTGDWRHVSTSTRNRRSSCESGPLTRIATENCKRKRYCGFVFYSLRQLVRLCSDFGAEFRAVPPNLIALMARQSPLLGSIRYLSPVARFR
jgi:hypothetical protein